MAITYPTDGPNDITAPTSTPTDMSRLFEPRSIAILGASSDPKKLSGRPVDYLKRFGFAGQILPINPSRDEVQGLTAYPTIESVGEPVDLAMVMVSAESTPDAIRACGRAGVGFAIVAASGFDEIGDAGQALDADLRAAVAESGVRVLGPNCLGLISLRNGAVPTFSPVLDSGAALIPGSVAFASQSGAFGSFIFAEVQHLRIGLSHYVTTGNEMNMSIADVLSGLVDDSAVRVLLAYAEGISDGDRLLEVAARAHRADKPIIMVKSGRSAAGADAARSHTASLAGDDAVFDALTRAHGVIRVASQDEVLDTAQLFRTQRRTRGRRLTVLSESGGAGVMMTDTATEVGLEVEPWDQQWQDKLAAVIPAFGSPRNPIDLTATLVTDASLMRGAMSLTVDHPDTDMIAVLVGNADDFADPLIEAISEFTEQTDRPVVVVWTGGSGAPRTRLRELGIPCYTDPVRAAKALGRLADHNLRPPLPLPQRPTGIDARTAREIVAHARRDDRTVLDEDESARLVRAYGIPVVGSRVARSAAEAAAAAADADGPVAVKVLSARIAHKSDIGGVRLGLYTADEVTAATTDLLTIARDHGEADPRVLIQQMRSGETELILGATSDPVFGPVVMVGFGGVLVELLRDSGLMKAPTDEPTADRALRGLGGAALFDGVRGGSPLDRAAVVDATVRLSWLIEDLADEVTEIDVNPLLVDTDGNGVVAVDALIRLHDTAQ